MAEALPEHIATISIGPGRVALYGRSTGRWIAVASDAPQTWIPRLQRAQMLAPPAQADAIPCRHRTALLLPDRPALWAADPGHPGPDGHRYRAIALSSEELSLWRAINEARPLRAVADRAGVDLQYAIEIVGRWIAFELQLLQLWPAPPRRAEPALVMLASPPRAESPRGTGLHTADGSTALGAYHAAIDDAQTRFDDVETTIAHALSDPHPGLGGLCYGDRLHAAVLAAGAPLDGLVVEIGPGTGSLAAAFSRQIAGPYLRIDASPALLAAQARAAPGTIGALADAVRLPLRDGSVPLLLCNEVIADLEAVRAPIGRSRPDVRDRIERYRIDALPDDSFYTLGAWKLVEEVARVLMPGGSALVTEFGDPDAPPAETLQLDHPEVSIRFGDLVAIATHLGLAAELQRLDAWLDVDLTAPQPARHSWRALRALAASHRRTLAVRAWTPATLPMALASAIGERVEGIDWTDLANEGPGPLITRFWALWLRRPV